MSRPAWDFDGDGADDLVSMSAAVQRVYSSTQSFSVRLTVTGPGGTDAEFKSGYITTVAPSSSNRAPVLVVARWQIFLDSLADMALLDANDSFDPDGDALCYSWREMPGNPVHGLIPIGSESLAKLPLYFSEPGQYEFEARISDGLDTCPEGRIVTVYVPGIKGVTRLARTSGLVNVPGMRVAVYATEADAEAGTNPVDVAISDSEGQFRLEGVSSASTEEGGTYYVREDGEGFATNSVRMITVWPDPSGKPEELYEWAMRRENAAGNAAALAGRITASYKGVILPVARAEVVVGAGLAGTDPTRIDSLFAIALVRGAGNEWRLATETSSVSRVYEVWWTTNLPDGEWMLMASNVWGNNGAMWVPTTNEVQNAWFRAKARVP